MRALPPSRTGNRGFTLVEVLVVVAVIGILAALAIPAFSRATGKADSARCAGNLRQLGVALQLYLADHGQKMPPLLAGRTGVSEEVPVIDNTLDAYVDDKRVFICPSGRQTAKTSGTSYYWNSVLSGQPALNLSFLVFSTDQSKIPVLMDKEGWHKPSQPGGGVNYLFADGHAGNQLALDVGQQ